MQAAILDINLNGKQVFSIADDLAQRNIPFVFFTGYDDILIPDRFRHASKLRKPVSWRRLLMALFDDAPASMGPAATAGGALSGAVPAEGALRADTIDTSGGAAQRRSGIEPGHDIISMLPMLRLAARLMLPDPAAADRLVKRTLQRAIIEADSKPQDVVLAGWLNDLMEQILAADGRKLMQ
ncbi:response regulator [Tistrella bauzanensis]